MTTNNLNSVGQRISALEAGVGEPWPVHGLVFAVGYEARSTHIARRHEGQYERGLGIRFGGQEEGAYAENARWADAAGIQSELCPQGQETRRALLAWLTTLAATMQGDETLRIAVDISSMSRMHIANVLVAARMWAGEHSGLRVAFLYSPASFVGPGFNHGPIVKFGSVTPEFAGVAEGSVAGLAAVVGLGYEPELAVATQQSLDPTCTWLAIPYGFKHEYDEAVSKANVTLLEYGENEVLPYNLMRPFDTFMRLESTVAGLRRDYSVVLVPLGPKLFALVSLLVALEHAPYVGVWRVSAEQYGAVVDRHAEGPYVGIWAEFRRHLW